MTSNPSFTKLNASDRGHNHLGWLDARHSFSFGSYRNPAYMHFASLRVLNEDRVRGGAGFDMHPHSNFEIVTYMLEGSLAHQDSMGNGSTIGRGDVQYMSAGSGVTHSEFNASAREEAHLLQIWFFPDVRDTPPRYAQKHFSDGDKKGRWLPIVTPDGRDGSLPIRQDVQIYATLLEASDSLVYEAAPERPLWLQIARGQVRVNGQPFEAGDGAGTIGQNIALTDAKDAEILLFDMAPFRS